ncbi:MAG: histidine phosphatase family protein [Aeriscardovia sp.]|nr:histidine phosphatase family protein [Aeriscardovia sp.]
MASQSVTTLYFVRHGEVNNPRKVVYERLPGFPLSGVGRLQAKRLASFLATQPEAIRASAFFSSSLDRTMETASYVLEAVNHRRAEENLTPLSIATDERLLEARNRYKGQRLGHGEASLFRNGNLLRFLNLRTPGWGESYDSIAARMTDFAFEKVDEFSGGSVIVVSHESPIWTLRHYLETGRAATNVLTRKTALASVTALSLEVRTHRLVRVRYKDPSERIVN